MPANLKAAWAVGVVASSTFAAYPLQMGLFPSRWYHLLTQWPNQHHAMATYVYAPVCTFIALVMFFATLKERGLADSRALAFLAAAMPLLLVATVTAQDIYFGSTSTQQLLLGVEASDPTPLVRIFW